MVGLSKAGNDAAESALAYAMGTCGASDAASWAAVWRAGMAAVRGQSVGNRGGKLPKTGGTSASKLSNP